MAQRRSLRVGLDASVASRRTRRVQTLLSPLAPSYSVAWVLDVPVLRGKEDRHAHP